MAAGINMLELGGIRLETFVALKLHDPRARRIVRVGYCFFVMAIRAPTTPFFSEGGQNFKNIKHPVPLTLSLSCW